MAGVCHLLVKGIVVVIPLFLSLYSLPECRESGVLTFGSEQLSLVPCQLDGRLVLCVGGSCCDTRAARSQGLTGSLVIISFPVSSGKGVLLSQELTPRFVGPNGEYLAGSPLDMEILPRFARMLEDWYAKTREARCC